MRTAAYMSNGASARCVRCAVAAMIVLAAGCATDDGAVNTGGAGETTEPAEADGDGSFGTLPDVCGPGDATVAADEAGLGTDKLYVGVTNDRSSTIRSGLNQELWDSSAGFVEWCNNAGGISGLQIEVVDVDAKILEVETAMARACTDTFALVGGGLVQDNLMLSGNEGTDFDMCGLVAIPAWAVSPEFSSNANVVTPLPNPATVKPTAFYEGLKEFRPDDMADFVSVYGEIPSIVDNMESTNATIEEIGGINVLDPIAYDAVGTQDWSIVAQQVIASGATVAQYIGEPENLAQLSKKLKEQDWPGLLISETNTFDPITIQSAGPDAVEGFVVRSAIKPLEEADEWPATAQYLDVMKSQPAAKLASLGIQGFSAWLLFADSVNVCATQGDGEVTRKCVVETAAANSSWSGGGLHDAAHLSNREPAPCTLAMEVRDGEFVRTFPELGSADDNGEGMYCSDPPFADIG